MDSRLKAAAKQQPIYAGFLADLLDSELQVRRDRYLKALMLTERIIDTLVKGRSSGSTA